MQIRILKKILSIVLTISLIPFTLHSASVVSPTFVPRSQGRDKTRQVVGVTQFTHQFDPYCADDYCAPATNGPTNPYYGLFSITPEWNHSFNSEHIAHVLFGDDLQGPCNDTIVIQGSTFTGDNRNPKAWLADYFYLPPDFNGSFSIKPTIKNFLIDFDCYIGLDSWVCGMYFRFYGPFNHTRWDLHYCEHSVTGTQSYPIGYFGPTEIRSENLLKTFSDYAIGNVPVVTGLQFDPLDASRLFPCIRTDNGFSDLRFEWGWDFWQCEYAHLGLNLQGCIPTSGKERPDVLFDTRFGNNGHWELGGGLTAHYQWFYGECDEHTFGFYLDANITHMFTCKQERTFDLKNKPNSRYMLALRMSTRLQNGLAGIGFDGLEAATPAIAQAISPSITNSSMLVTEYAPVANLTTLDVKVTVGVQADIVALFNYSFCNWSFDIGYNFWARSCEKFSCPNGCQNATVLCNASQENSWVLKGDARVYGFAQTSPQTPVPLSASESNADIHQGTNVTAQLNPFVAGSTDLYKNNSGIDNPQIARSTTLATNLAIAPTAVPTNADAVQTSIQPVFLTCNDINFVGTKGLTNKIFAHVSYSWESSCWQPFVGFGGFAEFGKNNSCSSDCSKDCTSTCDPCVDSSLSLWGVWLKTGVAFN